MGGSSILIPHPSLGKYFFGGKEPSILGVASVGFDSSNSAHEKLVCASYMCIEGEEPAE